MKVKKAQKKNYVDSSEEEIDISSDEEPTKNSDLVNFEKDVFLSEFRKEIIIRDPEIAFKNFNVYLKSHHGALYSNVLDKLMMEYREKMLYYQDLE